ncbi:MAG: CheR family methyltransferase [Bacteroidota bacterium]
MTQTQSIDFSKGTTAPGTRVSSQPRIISGLTELFRDPEYFRLIRQEIISYLETFSHPKVWHVGCSTGEEVFSMAILLQEAALFNKTDILATDTYQHRLIQAKNGRLSTRMLEQYQDNFKESGVKGKFEDYFNTSAGYLELKASLLQRLNFFRHDILQGASPNTFSCIFCRNVLFYYPPEKQVQILEKLLDSLSPMGFLVLGRVEDLRFSPLKKHLKILRKGYSIYQKTSF